MTETIAGIATDVEQLRGRVRELEQRVATLEAQSAASIAAAAASGTDEPVSTAPADEHATAAVAAPERDKPPATWRGFPPVETPAGVFTVLGKGVLGIAGAFLLRALAESGSLPKLAVVTVGIAYAGAWMVLATRAHERSRFASATYAATSALILAPMLWESTVRFHALTPAFAAAVLAGYSILTLAVAARRGLEMAPWVATAAVTVTAIGLIIATRALLPLTLALLTLALASEVSACTGHRLTQRVLAALVADFAVWQVIDVMTLSKPLPEGYQAMLAGTVTALCLALPAIYGGSLVVRGFLLRTRITYFDVVQSAVAFALGSFGALRATQGAAAAVLGTVLLALAGVCYWGALSRFMDEGLTRNRRIAATWAAVLLVAACWLLLPAGLQIVFLSVAAVVASLLYARTGKFSLGWHVSSYLAAAAVVSPLPDYVVNALARVVPGWPPWTVWIVAFAAAGSYAVGAHHGEAKLARRLLWVVPALLAGFAVAALAVSAIVGVAGGRSELAASRLSVVRTFVDCLVALGLGFLGLRWKRVELGWVAYAAVGFGTLKLLLEDLRFGNAASLVVSLLFYGGVLILLPRMMQRGKREPSEVT